jgi:tRNA G18 (ribose-2'-O)-methylase SpoU
LSLIVLEWPDDPRIDDYRAVGEPDLARRRGLFVAEGRFVVERLIASERFGIRSILLSHAAFAAMGPSLSALPPDVAVFVGPVSLLSAIAGVHIHRGCLALGVRPPDLEPRLLLDEATVLVLESIANADNVGGIFRNAAAFGVGGVFLSPACCDPLYRKAIRTSMAATLAVPFARLHDWPSDLRRLESEGFCVVALTPRGRTETLQAFASKPRPAKLALMLGAEGQGLSPAAEAFAHARVGIPIRSSVDSLNVAVAAGIALARLVERQ